MVTPDLPLRSYNVCKYPKNMGKTDRIVKKNPLKTCFSYGAYQPYLIEKICNRYFDLSDMSVAHLRSKKQY